MATKRSSKKRYCVQRQIEMHGVNNTNVNIVDVPQFLSKVNHRLYRQSRNYRAKVSLNEPNTRGNFEVFALRDTWFLQKAYQMAKDTFDKNVIEEASGMSKTQIARWQDFRIDLKPKNGVTYNMVNPGIRDDSLALQALTAGEFELSLVHKRS